MPKIHEQRINALRHWLKDQSLTALIIPHEDEYLGEYIASHNERLQWATGFTGSAGAAVITLDSAAIFVDGRYSVQVKKQVSSALFQYCHLTDYPIDQWLKDNLPKNSKIAIDSRMHSVEWFESIQEKLNKDKFTLNCIETNPIDELWQDRPELQLTNARLMATSIVGKNSTDKRQEIGEQLSKQGVDVAILTQLDSICWLLNIRGGDIPHLPVLIASAMIYASGDMILFIDEHRLTDSFPQHVGKGVRVLSPQSMQHHLHSLSEKTVLIDPKMTNAWTYLQLKRNGAKILRGLDPCMLPKAAKNVTEIDGMKACHITDGVAVCRFLAWLDNEISLGNLADEATLSDKLESYRRLDNNLIDLSFSTISAAGPNAAMCHYNHTNQQPAKLELNNVYLVDSGGQYLNGTTDITRTICVGSCNQDIKRMFTLVLKGHIALASARFPKGTTGSQLDVLARQYLWDSGFDYDHGTGHGVGHFLNVHEGPQRIAKVANHTELLPGMVLSNEPGYYRAEAFGIRIENLEVVENINTNGDKDMLGFTSLTRVPIDRRLVDISLLTEKEINWWNDYHQKVWRDISSFVNDDDLVWLKKACLPLSAII